MATSYDFSEVLTGKLEMSYIRTKANGHGCCVRTDHATADYSYFAWQHARHTAKQGTTTAMRGT